MSPQKSALIAFYFLSILASFGQSRVNATAGPGQRDVRTQAGQPVPNGNSVWIGTFAPGFNAVANAGDPDALLSNWRSYGITPITTIIGQPGRFNSSSTSFDPVFDNQKIWLWIFKTDDNTAPEQDFANVAEYGLFSSTLANWKFPPAGTLPPSNLVSINSSQVDQAVFGAVDGTHLYLSYVSAPIPEPSCFHLMLVALGTFVSVRWSSIGRRNK